MINVEIHRYYTLFTCMHDVHCFASHHITFKFNKYNSFIQIPALNFYNQYNRKCKAAIGSWHMLWTTCFSLFSFQEILKGWEVSPVGSQNPLQPAELPTCHSSIWHSQAATPKKDRTGHLRSRRRVANLLCEFFKIKVLTSRFGSIHFT